MSDDDVFVYTSYYYIYLKKSVEQRTNVYITIYVRVFAFMSNIRLIMYAYVNIVSCMCECMCQYLYVCAEWNEVKT